MHNKTAHNSIIERLGLGNMEVTPFTLYWLEKAFNEENCDILKSFLDSESILSLNKLTDEQKQILNALPVNQIHEIDESFRNGTVSMNPMHIAMTMIGYKVFCNECGSYIVNDDALILTTDDEDEVCPHCHLDSGLTTIFSEFNYGYC